MKWRLFRHLLDGNDPDAERVYRWHIAKRSGHRMQAGLPTDKWKTTLLDYENAARGLLWSIRYCGFVGSGAIPVDPNGELLDGSHRVACALALGIDPITVAHHDRVAWAPAWGETWFVENGMAAADLERLRADYAALASGSG